MKKCVLSIMAGILMTLPNTGRSVELINDTFVMSSVEEEYLKTATVLGVLRTDPFLHEMFVSDPVGVLMSLRPLLGDHAIIIANMILTDDPPATREFFFGCGEDAAPVLTGEITSLATGIKGLVTEDAIRPRWWPPWLPWPPINALSDLLGDPWIDQRLDIGQLLNDRFMEDFALWAMSEPGVLHGLDPYFEFLVIDPSAGHTVALPGKVLRNGRWANAVWQYAMHPYFREYALSCLPIEASAVFGLAEEDYCGFGIENPVRYLALAGEVLLDNGWEYSETIKALETAFEMEGIPVIFE